MQQVSEKEFQYLAAQLKGRKDRSITGIKCREIIKKINEQVDGGNTVRFPETEKILNRLVGDGAPLHRNTIRRFLDERLDKQIKDHSRTYTLRKKKREETAAFKSFAPSDESPIALLNQSVLPTALQPAADPVSSDKVTVSVPELKNMIREIITEMFG